jgi:hypothetical protein
MAINPEGIALRRVDHPPAGFVESVEDGKARILVSRPAKHIAAQAQADAAD